ncbi:Protein CBG24405 [Caenorhabditis briggsae]|uniref:Protein CBG24405 n=1 Tax=Caenorhabditis briggsae TaxID=6238 RepID=A8WKM8_CAEBR|nr:Protein CBG24405 [Caenorhabditis briggsae]CAP21023.1 Protein CBG24405 [Caenorhabditis briggsae]
MSSLSEMPELVMETITGFLDFRSVLSQVFSKFEIFMIEVENFNEKEELLNLWGTSYLSESSIYWYFRIRDSEENILVVDHQQEFNHMFFFAIETRDVSNGKIVHDYNKY